MNTKSRNERKEEWYNTESLTTEWEPVRSESEVANGPVVGNKSVEEGGWLSPPKTSTAGLILLADGLWPPNPECTLVQWTNFKILS